MKKYFLILIFGLMSIMFYQDNLGAYSTEVH